ncbi:MAG: ral nucleoside transport system permease protein [Actinomycetota bacterium]|nr:ral nucleoside transport system permease protein [Actinomycetota bacterium]
MSTSVGAAGPAPQGTGPAKSPGRSGPSPRRGPLAPGGRTRRLLVATALGLLALSIARVMADEPVLTSSGTMTAVLGLSLPIALAGLAGLVSERAGVVNIGLEGMMILGTWGAGYGGYQYGVWGAFLGALLAGTFGGLLHAVATVSFGVDHIVSGVAINLLAAGAVRFLSELLYKGVPGGGPTQSPTVRGGVSTFDLPVLSSGPDLLGRAEDTGLPVVADLAGILRGFTTDLTVFAVLGLALFPFFAFFLWRTALGLRWRAAGENPYAAQSLGVDVYRMKYLAVLTSGALSGLGGLFIVLFSGLYKEGQTGGRGFIGLAAMIFGNWRPGGVVGGSLLFGFSDAVRLRSSGSGGVLALFLFAAILLAALAVRQLARGHRLHGAALAGIATAAALTWSGLDSLPNEVTTMTPYIVTLLVLVISSQNLRMPTYDGVVYRRGEDH